MGVSIPAPCAVTLQLVFCQSSCDRLRAANIAPSRTFRHPLPTCPRVVWVEGDETTVRFEKHGSPARLISIGVVQMAAQKHRCAICHGHGTCGHGRCTVPEMENGKLMDASVEGLMKRVLRVAIAHDPSPRLDLLECSPSLAGAQRAGLVLFAESGQRVERRQIRVTVDGVLKRRWLEDEAGEVMELVGYIRQRGTG